MQTLVNSSLSPLTKHVTLCQLFNYELLFVSFLLYLKLQSICVAILTVTPSSLAKA